MGLRIFSVSHPILQIPDRSRGTTLLAGAEGWFRKEGSAYVRINADGFRDVDHGTQKNSNIFRIAVLGDSFVEALQVPLEQTFWNILENRLSQCSAFKQNKVEVLGFGVSGYGTAQQLLTYREKIRKYQPDLVLLAFYTGNDVRNNHRALERSPWRPYFTLQDEKLALDASFQSTPEFSPNTIEMIKYRSYIINRIRTLQVLRQAIVALREWRESANASTVYAGSELGINDEAFLPPRREEWKEAWTVTERIIEQLNAEVTTDGAMLWIVTLTSGIQVNPDLELRQRFKRRLGETALDYPDRRIARFAKENDIPVVTLIDSFLRYASTRKVHFHGFAESGNLDYGHWNSVGHRLAGEVIARRICNRK